MGLYLGGKRISNLRLPEAEQYGLRISDYLPALDSNNATLPIEQREINANFRGIVEIPAHTVLYLPKQPTNVIFPDLQNWNVSGWDLTNVSSLRCPTLLTARSANITRLSSISELYMPKFNQTDPFPFWITGSAPLAKLSLPALQTANMSQRFQSPNITDIDLPALENVVNSGLSSTFSNTHVTEVIFPRLTKIDRLSGMAGTFENCPYLTMAAFPALTTIYGDWPYQWALENCFYNCPNLEEIHFRADSRAVIESQSTYDTNFGAPNATIYFDL